MSHPLPTDPVRGPGLPEDADRSARVDELLVAGLDRYLEGRYEEAINIWTRVAFLDRDHDRARAYIDRARRALAERQRESDEALERGIAAYHAGELGEARALLTRALAQGDAGDRALVFLDRLGRLDERVATATAAPRAHGRRPPAVPAAGRRPTWWPAAAIGAVAVAALAGALLAGWPGATPATSGAVSAPVGDPLPVARVSESALDEAKRLYATGALHEALAALDGIDAASPLRREADRLRAEVQQAVLAGVPSLETGEAR